MSFMNCRNHPFLLPGIYRACEQVPASCLSSPRIGGQKLGHDRRNDNLFGRHINSWAKASLVFCLPFRQTFALNWGESAFRQNKHDQLWSCCFPSLFPCVCLKMTKICCFLGFHKGKKEGRKRTRPCPTFITTWAL